MADPKVSAPSRAHGVVHVRTRHTDRFTVVGNHLAQHRELTLTAIGLAVHIQSLPEGARVDIKSLAARFPEGETRIASALRELEAHGYLSRTRERLPSGRIVTHTVAYGRPRGGEQQALRPGRPVPVTQAVAYGRPAVEPQQAPRPAGPVRVAHTTAYDGPGGGQQAVRPARPVPVTPVRDATPRPARPVQPVQGAAPPAPPPRCPATDLLADLRRHDERLLLSARDVHRLAPAVSAWLERGVSPAALRGALTTGLPDIPRHPAGLLAHRLAALPEPPLPAPPGPPPLQNCDGCDRAFRSPAPGHCRSCRTGGAVQVA